MVSICYICSLDWALNVFWFNLDLFGHPVIAHFGIPRSIPAHSQNLSNLFSCICIDVSLFAIIARLSVYAAKFIVILDVPNVYPFLPLSNHLDSGSTNIIKRYGLRMSPCIVPYCIDIFCILPKCYSINMVFECE